MPVTVKVGTRNPYDSGGPLKLNIVDKIDLVAPERDIPFLRTLGWGASAEDVVSGSRGADSLPEPCVSVKYSWLNDVLVPSQGTITADRASGAGTITVSTTEVLYFRVDDIVRVVSTDAAITAATADLIFLVTAINTGTGVLTVTVLTADAAADNGDTWYLMGNAKEVGSDANTDGKHTVLTQTDNFTQIFMDDARVAGTEEAQAQYGITDPMARELDKTFQRLIVQFERAVTYGYRSSVIPAASTTASRMGGFFYYTRVASGGLTYDLAGAPISEQALDAMIDTIWRAGGTPTIIMMNSVGLRELRKFNRPFVQTSRTERTAGLVVDRYESAVGIDLDVVLNRHIGDGDFLIMSKEFIGVGPLKGNGVDRSFTAQEIPYNGGDYRRMNILGEYTACVRNYTTHHMWAYGGATSVSS